MTQEPSAKAIGKRIRALRGDETQADFAEKIGLTRAALANYETGRTVPKDIVILKIANLTGVEPSSIASTEAYSFDDLAALLGAKRQVDGLADLTPDERAFIRLLRACDEETVLTVAGYILDAVQAGRINRYALDPLTFEFDVTMLAKVRADGGRYIKGMSRDTLRSLLEGLGEKDPE